MTSTKEPRESAVRWAVGLVGPGAALIAATGLREGSNPWLLRIEHDTVMTMLVLKTVNPEDSHHLPTEVTALRLAQAAGLPVPRVVGVDLTGAEAGLPALVESVVPGRSAIPAEPSARRLRTMGEVAAALHAITVEPSPQLPPRVRPIANVDFPQLRRQGVDRPTPLLTEAEDRLSRLPVPAGPVGLVHGDLWQGNMMFEGEQLRGLLDWDMAGSGQAGVDLSAMRLDAVLMYGPDAAAPVLDAWTAHHGGPPADLAYWDAVAAVNQPGDMAAFVPVMHDQGRVDLTADLLNGRRDGFLRSALDRLP